MSRPFAATRKAITDRLGLPESATNDQVFAAVDQVVASRRPKAPAGTPGELAALLDEAAARNYAIADADYRALFGDDGTKPGSRAAADTRSDDELYRELFGSDA